tara:strand:+ start:4014 stop:4598 length:585 start_codon:yes stop_codon:yes gene_type:complete
MNIEEAITNIYNYNGFVKIPFAKTMMTVPAILLGCLRFKSNDPKRFLKNLGESIDEEIKRSDLSKDEVRGKLSTKIQEFAWSNVLYFDYKPKLKSLKKSETVPYVYLGKKSTMTVPNYIVEIEISRKVHEGDKREYRYIKKDVISDISEIASSLREEVESSSKGNDVKMRFSQKIQELVIKRSITRAALKQEAY